MAADIKELIENLQDPHRRLVVSDRQEAAEMLAITENGYQEVTKVNDRLQALIKEMTFMLDTTMDGIIHFWGEEAADKIRVHLAMARKSRANNAEIDDLEKLFAPLT